MTTTESTPVTNKNRLGPNKEPQHKSATADLAGALDVGKVRDAMLSSQLLEIDRRYARTEEKLGKDLANLRSELMARMDTMESLVKAELTSISTILTQESQDRQAHDKQLGDDVHATKSAFAKDYDALRQTVAKGERDLRQLVMESSKTLSSELHRLHDDLELELSGEIQALDIGKVAKTGLASMLSDVITRLDAGASAGDGRLGSHGD